ncbi:pep a2 [Streptomyces hygroscopicus]|uniref:pep a2 n=1 Tax=Streptomyces hygroscopicus TaxID=1912 RepID=UPI002240DFA0|nr:pep a2 [Streptomyces hygroscopicus]MCW7945066.1 pep a2 [Streptomyces hygroscopicus]
MKTAAPCYYHLDVEISPERIGQVQRILAAHLRYWNLEMLVEPVCQCTEALMRTIDAHASDKNTTIEMWWNGQHLITAIQDSERDIRPHYAPSGCLVQIAALSNGWGCCATGTGGKIIWFSQRARSAERAPLVPVAPAPSLRETRPLPRALPLAAVAAAPEQEGAEKPAPAMVDA